MINDASVVIGGGNWGIKEADVLGYKLINNEFYAREIDFANSTADGTYTDPTGYVRRSPYNLFTYSEELDNVLWLKNNITIVPNAGVAPNNTNTADSYSSTATFGPHPCYQSKVVIRNTYTYSVYVKKVNSRYVSLKGAGGRYTWTGVIFDLDTASVVSIQNVSIPGTTGSITSEGNGWYRISMTATSNFNDFGLQYASSPSNNFGDYGDLTITGSGLVDYLLWGMQVVQGSSPMPYFYTTTRLNVPRIDYRNTDGTLSTTGKVLIEPQRTNSIRNSSMSGAFAGTPGVLPTNWSEVLAGLTRNVVAVGTENGLPYVDIRFNGTASGTIALVAFESNSAITASVGQSWSNNVYVKNIDTTAQANQVLLTTYEYNSVGAYLSEGSTNIRSQLTTSLKRFDFVRTLASATVARVQPMLQFILTNGQTYDFTIRIAAPQMELGAYATTWIPTTNATVTRNADLASKTGVSSLIGQTQGTLFCNVNIRVKNDSVRALQVSDGTLNNRIQLAFNVNDFTPAIITGGVSQASFSVPFSDGNNKVAIAYANNYVVVYLNGAQVGTDTSATIPACSLLEVGQSSGLNILGDTIAQAIIFPTRLTDEQLSQLTTL